MKLQVDKNMYGFDRKPYHPLVIIENEPEHSEPSCNWFIPSSEAVCGMLRSVGFEDIQTVYTSNSRGIFTARKPKAIRDSLNPNGLKAKIELLELTEPIKVHCGESITLNVKCTNIGQNTWRSLEAPDGKGTVFLCGQLTQPEDPLFEIMLPWSAIEREVSPGESVLLSTNFAVPNVAGIYELELDLVSNHVGLFQEFGSKPLNLEIQVG